MIEFKNVTKVYSKGVKAVDNISFKIEEGEIFGFLGPNGAGKSTSLKMLVGILEQSEGKITVNGVDTLEDSIKVKEMISYVPDNPDIYTKMTGIKYLNFIADIYGIDEKVRKEKIEEYNRKLELGDAIYSTIESYSHGMRQKLVLIGALITSPKVLILDEPMVGLDPAAIKELKKVIFEMKDRGVTVLLSTHMLEMVQELWDTLYIMDHGKVIGTYENDGTQNQNIEDLFFSLTDKEDEKESEE